MAISSFNRHDVAWARTEVLKAKETEDLWFRALGAQSPPSRMTEQAYKAAQAHHAQCRRIYNIIKKQVNGEDS